MKIILSEYLPNEIYFVRYRMNGTKIEYVVDDPVVIPDGCYYGPTSGAWKELYS